MRTNEIPPEPRSEKVTLPICGETLQQDRLSVIGYMASSAAHDISNPLATIAASAQAILAFWPRNEAVGVPGSDSVTDTGFAEDSPVRQFREDLELILAEAQRAGEIVANLLAFARDETPQWYPVSMASLIRQVITLTRHHLSQRSVEIRSNVLESNFGTPGWSWVLGDAGHLKQVLTNLIINAEQAIRSVKHGGAITIHLRPDSVNLVRVVVQDDGPGVPPNLHKTIFKAFYTTKQKGEGTGLGLSIAAGIISRHGGQLQVCDRESGGAEFAMILPSTPPPDRAETHHGHHDLQLEAQIQSPGGRGSVLLVDDEAGIRRSVGRFLRRFGCEVEAVATGTDAVAALADREYDAVVTDLRMPGLSGEELYQVLQQTHPHMTARIVFTSGDMMRPETRAFLNQCGCPSLQKPYELGELVRILERMWSGSVVSPPTT